MREPLAYFCLAAICLTLGYIGITLDEYKHNYFANDSKEKEAICRIVEFQDLREEFLDYCE